MLRMAIKYFLLMLPNSPIKVDGRCPKCGYPLEAKSFIGKTYFVCKNPFCDYYSEGIDVPKKISDNNFIGNPRHEKNSENNKGL